MPDITVIHIVLFVITTVIGAVAGWVVRGNRSEQEKSAVSAGWQEQIDAQRKEHDRLLDQNKSLMEQVSQYQASNTDAKNRAKELSLAVQEAFERRDELQREIKDIRSNLEVAVNERNQLQSDMEAHGAHEQLLRQKDEYIEKLSKELENWQNRLPPLIERYRIRNEEAEQAESELAEARERIRQLENEQTDTGQTQTRIEPVHDPDDLTDGLDASNDPDKAVVDAFVTSIEEVLTGEDETSVAETLDESDVEEPAPEPEPEPEAEPEPEDDSVYEPEGDAQDDADAAPDVAADSHNDRDDLKMIKGVGPAIEKTLNELGIVNFRQIADMSEYDIDRVARKLKGFHSRIYREDWIGQARELLRQAANA